MLNVKSPTKFKYFIYYLYFTILILKVFDRFVGDILDLVIDYKLHISPYIFLKICKYNSMCFISLLLSNPYNDTCFVTAFIVIHKSEIKSFSFL